jgi:hypothetical protein
MDGLLDFLLAAEFVGLWDRSNLTSRTWEDGELHASAGSLGRLAEEERHLVGLYKDTSGDSNTLDRGDFWML